MTSPRVWGEATQTRPGASSRFSPCPGPRPRFAHQFLDPGTYVFRDSRLPESMAVVLVKEEGAACGPGPARVQPSSPEQLARHGVLRRGLPALDPDWTAITGMARD